MTTHWACPVCGQLAFTVRHPGPATVTGAPAAVHAADRSPLCPRTVHIPERPVLVSTLDTVADLRAALAAIPDATPLRIACRENHACALARIVQSAGITWLSESPYLESDLPKLLTHHDLGWNIPQNSNPQ